VTPRVRLPSPKKIPIQRSEPGDISLPSRLARVGIFCLWGGVFFGGGVLWDGGGK